MSVVCRSVESASEDTRGWLEGHMHCMRWEGRGDGLMGRKKRKNWEKKRAFKIEDSGRDIDRQRGCLCNGGRE